MSKTLIAAFARPMILPLLLKGESYGYRILQDVMARFSDRGRRQVSSYRDLKAALSSTKHGLSSSSFCAHFANCWFKNELQTIEKWKTRLKFKIREAYYYTRNQKGGFKRTLAAYDHESLAFILFEIYGMRISWSGSQ